VRMTVAVGRPWAGGAPTAVVAAPVALQYALTADLALVATGSAHVLGLTTPRPRVLSRIVGLAAIRTASIPRSTPPGWRTDRGLCP